MERLVRNEYNKTLAGVCSGLADYFETDPTLVRIIFVIAAFFGFGILAYIILWIVVPANTNINAQVEYYANQYNKKQQQYQGYGAGPVNANAGAATAPAPDARSNFGSVTARSRNFEMSRRIIGMLLIALGIFFSLRQLDILPEFLDASIIFPIALIIIGASFILRGSDSGRVYQHLPKDNTAETPVNSDGMPPHVSKEPVNTSETV